jgi:hypothetical protein
MPIKHAKGLIALDADGVLLDYSQAYAKAWERAFGVFPREVDPLAYWPHKRWEVEWISGERLNRFRSVMDETHWSEMPAVKGALEACQMLDASGFELVCVTALPPQFREARLNNLRALGFPINTVHATDNESSTESPKAAMLNSLQPVAFVDDFLPYLVGVDKSIHCALVMRGVTGSPNQGELLSLAASQHADLLAFARWWVAR